MKNIDSFENFNKNTNKKTNEGWFSGKKKKDSKLEEINRKITDASYSLKSFGSMTRQAAFINGAKWVLHNLTDDEIKYLREKSDKDDFSFFGI